MNKPTNSHGTPWNRIYLLILLYNALLIFLFSLVRHYFNID
jgi:hypothetical protein